MTAKRLLKAGASLLLAVLFGLIFYTFNTPLGPSVGSDNAIYLTMGTAVASGYTPYTEIFDHKGPLVFLLQTIPQLLSGGYSTLAVFIQQVLFLCGCLLVVDAIAVQLGARCTWAVQLVYLALIAAHVGGGNLTEEYTNLFTLLGLWLVLRVFGPGASQRGARRYVAPAAMLGALAMLCLLTRANNVLPLCGVILALSLSLLAQKRLAELGCCALGMLAGCAGAALPVVLWLAAKGALADAFYGAFTHNMMYAETDGVGRVQMLFTSAYGRWAILMAALACAGALVLLLRSRRFTLPLAITAGAAMGGLAAFVSHKYYAHYLILGAPLAAMGAAALLAGAQALGSRRGLAAVCAALLLSGGVLLSEGREANAQRLSELDGAQAFAENAQALYAQVPEDERSSFMAYRVEPKWYVYAEALPCMRFYFLQEILAEADPAVMDEIVATFENDPPAWLVIYYNREFGPPYDERVAAIFESEYEFVDAKGQYQLLCHKESGR